MQANISNTQILLESVRQLNSFVQNLENEIKLKLNELNKLLEEINQELAISENFLNLAQAQETQKATLLAKAKEELERALQALAMARENEIESATAWVKIAKIQVAQAQSEFDRAKKNRINMQRRVDIVKKAKFNTERLISESHNIFNTNFSNITFLQQSVNMRLQKAYHTLDGYFSNESYLKDLKIVKPNNLRDMFKLNDKKTKEYFDYFYASNEKFRKQVDKLKSQYHQAKTPFEKEKVLRQIRRNLVGDFAEKYIEKSLSSLGDIKTQHIEKMDDSFSKVDIRIENVKKPTILGKGDCGKFVKEGGTLSIEIKTGQKEYLKSQKEHLIFQTQAHKKSSDASMILTTKDIYDLQDEDGFREVFRDDCVSIMAGLPYKQELDQWIIDSMEL